MGQRDALQRNRAAIIEVLDAHGITTYTDCRKAGNQAIRVSFQGRTGVISYSGVESRHHAAPSRAAARRVLHDLGSTAKAKPAANQPPEGPPRARAREAAVHAPQQEGTPDAPQAETPTSGVAAMNDFPDPAELDAVMADTLSQSEDHAPPTGGTRAGGGYVLFDSTKHGDAKLPRYQPARFIAVKLEHELIAEAGTYLVIPTHADNIVMAMQPDEFRAFFAPAQACDAPCDAPAAGPARGPRWPGRAISEADAPVAVPEPAMQRPVAPPPPVVPAPASLGVEGVEPMFPPAGEAPAARNPFAPNPAVRHPVSPQMGRVLLAMYALHGNNQPHVGSAAVHRLLPDMQKNSLWNAISRAITARHVVKLGRQRSERTGRYRLSNAGMDVCAKLGSWPFDAGHMPLPAWLPPLLDDAAPPGAAAGG